MIPSVLILVNSKHKQLIFIFICLSQGTSSLRTLQLQVLFIIFM